MKKRGSERKRVKIIKMTEGEEMKTVEKWKEKRGGRGRNGRRRRGKEEGGIGAQ